MNDPGKNRSYANVSIKFFAEITYQWITVTHLLLQPPHFHPSLCPRGHGGYLSVDYRDSPFIATTPFSSFVVPVPGMGVS